MTLLWIGFIIFVLGMLALDLGVLNRRPHQVRTREALLWSLFCVILALGFNILVFFIYHYHFLGVGLDSPAPLSGHEAAMQFFTGWLIEQSLSLDNIFVIALIFAYFRVPQAYQHRALFWGIVGALVMRGVMIALGSALIERFSWITYVFGALLILTALKLVIAGDQHVEPERNILVRLARRLAPVSPTFDGQRFFTRIDGRRAITPLMLVLLVIESTDVLFAVDSIPAIFAITRDPFIVFTSNIFAILNLRSLYFALSHLLERFRYLKHSLVFILALVGVKMLLAHVYTIPVALSMGLIVLALALGIIVSLVRGRRVEDVPQADESLVEADVGGRLER